MRVKTVRRATRPAVAIAMKGYKLALWRLLALALTGASALGAADTVVRINTGLIQGEVTGVARDVRVFRGIPYAAPPVGDLRWKPPKEPAPWQGVRDGREFGPACEQRDQAAAYEFYQSDFRRRSEDCLYLSVYTPAESDSGPFPVMVWIHGGALTNGTGASYDGAMLARKGVVVVTINYRLNVFGFLGHPALSEESEHGSSGLYGILDQVAALRWVQKNIRVFGGDPDRVMIFGESAGSWSVCYLMASPLARGLFHRAIGQSGGVFGPMPPLKSSKPGEPSVEAVGEQLFASHGADSSSDPLAAMRSKPARELLEGVRLGQFRSPPVDGWAFPQEVRDLFAQGRHNDVPVIVGSNEDEASALYHTTAPKNAAEFRQSVRQSYGTEADAFLGLYPADTDTQAVQSHYRSRTERGFTWPMHRWARTVEGSGGRAYLYYFRRIPPGPWSERYGAYHGAEVIYVFGLVWPWKERPAAPHAREHPYEQIDRELSDSMSSYWVNFARTGDPNAGGLPQWPPYERAKDQALEFGDVIRVIPVPVKERLAFWDRYYAKR